MQKLVLALKIYFTFVLLFGLRKLQKNNYTLA